MAQFHNLAMYEALDLTLHIAKVQSPSYKFYALSTLETNFFKIKNKK